MPIIATPAAVRARRTDWLADALGNAEFVEILADNCRRYDFAAGDVIARQGGPSNSMHFIIDGRMGIMVNLEDGSAIRVRSLGRHTTIGEMGLLTGRPRSATVQAEVASVAYELRADAFERLEGRASRFGAGAPDLCDRPDGGTAEFCQPGHRRPPTLTLATRLTILCQGVA